MNWIKVKDELPKLKVSSYKNSKGHNIVEMQGSVDCIVTDGENVFYDTYDSEEGFHDSITHYVIIENIPMP